MYSSKHASWLYINLAIGRFNSDCASCLYFSIYFFVTQFRYLSCTALDRLQAVTF